MRRFTTIVALGSLGLCLATAPVPVNTPAERAEQRSARPVLNRPIPELRLQGVSLIDALDFLRDTTGANIHVNWRALEEAGISKDAPVTTRLTNVPLRKALSYVLAEAAAGQSDLTWYVEGGVIEVTTRDLADRVMITRVYTVEDLLMEVPDFVGPQFDLQNASQQATSGGGGGGGGGQSLFGSNNGSAGGEQTRVTKDERGEGLVQLITETVRPDIWRANGGPASIRHFRGMLIVTAPRSVHEAIAGR